MSAASPLLFPGLFARHGDSAGEGVRAEMSWLQPLLTLSRDTRAMGCVPTWEHLTDCSLSEIFKPNNSHMPYSGFAVVYFLITRL